MKNRQLYINDILCDLPDNSPVAITFQINNLADLQDRQSTYTNSIKLPKSSVNSRALGYANIDAFTQNEPYENIPCKYVENGVEVIPFGIVKIQAVSDYFEVQLLYGVAGFTDITEDKSIKRLDFSDYNFPHNIDGVIESQNAQSGYLWPVIDVGNLGLASIVDIRYLRPAFFTKTILEKIGDLSGYKFTGFILNDKFFKKEMITAMAEQAPFMPSGEDLPDFSIKDFVKDLMQRYFLTPEVDNYKKTVRLRSFDELYNNIPNAKDWTDKFVNDSRTDSFYLPGYAQKNKFDYTETDTINLGRGEILVDNKTLEGVKEAVTSIYTPIGNYFNRLGGLIVAGDALMTDNPLVNEASNPRVLYNRYPQAGSIYQFTDSVFTEFGTNISIPYFYSQTLDGLEWKELIKRYGQGLVKMLAKTRVITRYAILNEYDVYNFDYFTPVFDRIEAKYYYVNQIINWQPNKKVKVNLIRL